MSQTDAANEEEIEVTAEMVEAGLRAFSEFDVRFDRLEDAIMEVFREMFRAGRRPAREECDRVRV